MNTTAHLLLGSAAFGSAKSRRVSIAALLGAFVPDVSLYILCGVSIFILGISPHVVFDELYFSDSWQTVFSIDNSFILWGAVFAIAIARKQAVLIAFTASALLHLFTDFAMHHDDARAHFWPVTDWRFVSPVSYWDRAHHAQWVAPLEGLVALVCAVVLCFRHSKPLLRFGVLVLLIAELLIIRQWLMFF